MARTIGWLLAMVLAGSVFTCSVEKFDVGFEKKQQREGD